ncbi:MAG: alpha/beta hydrolase [Synechococcaceae cyanobacterium RL_1_2]|nr:alpha/beta hydrolase [Synechococcaceae cyanobacterium RL_1_2]
MIPTFIPPQANELTETTSINLIRQIQYLPLPTELESHPIATTFSCHGEDNGKPPFLLLHGFDSSLLEYRRLIPRLEHDRQTWTMDLLGFGFTERRPTLPFSPEGIKTHLYEFWRSQINRPVVLVGASMGGATAIDFALTYPETIAQLILIDSAGLTPKSIASKFIFPPLDRLATNFLRSPKVRFNISKTAYADPKYASADACLCAELHLYTDNWDKALIAFTKSGGYGSFGPQLRQMQPQTLILWGKQDKILGIKPAYKFQKLMPQAQFHWIEKAGHVPHLEQPQITAEIILSFLAGSA